MPLGSDYNKLDKKFDPNYSGGGVIFPFTIPAVLDFDTASTNCLGDYSFPFKVRLITAQAWCAAAFTTASVNPIIGIAIGTSGVASAGLATEVATITATSPGELSSASAEATTTKWNGSTTATDIETTQSIWVYLKTAAAKGSYPSTAEDGSAQVVLWLAVLNGP